LLCSYISITDAGQGEYENGQLSDKRAMHE